MPDPDPELVGESKAEWAYLVDHPYATEPIERTSDVPDEKVLADEQAAYIARYRKRPNDPRTAGADAD